MRYSLFPVLVALFLTNTFSCQERTKEVAPAPKGPSLKEKIGQMIMVGFRGTTADGNSPIHRLIKEDKLGGVVLYNRDLPSGETIPRNITSPKQLRALTTALQAVDSVPLLIAIDEEGGRVSRLSPQLGFRSHASHQHIGNLDQVDATKAWAANMAQELAGLGINMNFGPDVDLNRNPENPIIGGIERSFSDSLPIVLKHANLFIEAHQKEKILCTPKHFPGHGSSKNDTHKGLADVTHTWDEKELIPFKELMHKTGIIMTSHVYNAHLDTLPATLSKKTIQNLLRKTYNFNGVVISDDMQMRAISNFYDFETAIEKAILAGVDMLLFSANAAPCPEGDEDCIELPFDPYLGRRAIAHIHQLVQGGVIPQKRIEESYQRIMALKSNL